MTNESTARRGTAEGAENHRNNLLCHQASEKRSSGVKHHQRSLVWPSHRRAFRRRRQLEKGRPSQLQHRIIVPRGKIRETTRCSELFSYIHNRHTGAQTRNSNTHSYVCTLFIRRIRRPLVDTGCHPEQLHKRPRESLMTDVRVECAHDLPILVCQALFGAPTRNQQRDGSSERDDFGEPCR